MKNKLIILVSFLLTYHNVFCQNVININHTKISLYLNNIFQSYGSVNDILKNQDYPLISNYNINLGFDLLYNLGDIKRYDSKKDSLYILRFLDNSYLSLFANTNQFLTQAKTNIIHNDTALHPALKSTKLLIYSFGMKMGYIIPVTDNFSLNIGYGFLEMLNNLILTSTPREIVTLQDSEIYDVKVIDLYHSSFVIFINAGVSYFFGSNYVLHNQIIKKGLNIGIDFKILLNKNTDYFYDKGKNPIFDLNISSSNIISIDLLIGYENFTKLYE